MHCRIDMYFKSNNNIHTNNNCEKLNVIITILLQLSIIITLMHMHNIIIIIIVL